MLKKWVFNLFFSIFSFFLFLILTHCSSQPSVDVSNNDAFDLIQGIEVANDSLSEDFIETDKPWWLDNINAFYALQNLSLLQNELSHNWHQEKVVIAVLDSGIDESHEALKNKIWKHDHSLPPIGIDQTSNVCPLDQPLKGSCQHGTMVAGLINGSHKEGVYGICQSCYVLNLRVVTLMPDGAKVLDEDLISALDHVNYLKTIKKVPIKVINVSIGKKTRSKKLELGLQRFLDKHKDVVIVAASGNQNTFDPLYPAAYPEVLSVAASGLKNKKSSYSNYGPWVDIVAPGGDGSRLSPNGYIFSSVPGGGTSLTQGTSMATPIVSGTLGLMFQKDPTLTRDKAIAILLNATQREILSSYTVTIKPEGFKESLLGNGLLDVFKAMEFKENFSLQEKFSLKGVRTKRSKVHF